MTKLTFILLILTLLNCTSSKKENEGVKNDSIQSTLSSPIDPNSKILNLDFGFKVVTGKEEDFEKFKTYSYFELRRNDRLLFVDSSAEYEFGDKMYPLIFKKGRDSFELIFEINGRPNKNYLNRLIISDDKVVSQEKLPTFIGKPVDINKDGVKEYAGFMFYGQAFGRDYDLTGYNPILYYSVTSTGLRLDSVLTKQRNELIYGHFYGFEYSGQFEQPITVMKKFEGEIKLIEGQQ